MLRSHGNNTQDLDPDGSGLQAAGAIINSSINVHLKDCQFNNSFGTADFIVEGANLSNNQNMVCDDCQFNKPRGGEFTTLINGIHMSDAPFQETEGNGIKFLNCQFNGATRDAIGEGNPNLRKFFYVTGARVITLKNVIFENCQAVNDSSNNPAYSSHGFTVGTNPTDPLPPFSNSRNIVFKNTVVSDIFSVSKRAVGIFLAVEDAGRAGQQSSLANATVSDCTIHRIRSSSSTELVAGIAEGLLDDPLLLAVFPAMFNLQITDCQVSDVKAGPDNPLSAGIVVQSVQRPHVVRNTVFDCDRGVLLTGTNEISPNCFQLAITEENALAEIPIFVPISRGVRVITNQPGIGPFTAAYTTNGPRLVEPISAQTETTNPPNACSAVTNDLSGLIAIVQQGVGGFCSSAAFVLNTEAAGQINPIEATLIISRNDTIVGFPGSSSQEQVAVVISRTAGNILLAALQNNPNLIITIDTVPSLLSSFTFTNVTRDPDTSVTISQAQITDALDFICVEENLEELGWEAGDEILFQCNEADIIPGLLCDTSYFLIVYRPGFSERGLIKENDVSNNLVAGYQDDRTPTSSAWISNVAFCNGESADDNYVIDWPGDAPVATSIGNNYPVPASYIENVSIACAP